MPPLTPLKSKENASDDAKRIAMRIPLIHVTHREGRPDFLELLLGNGVIPTSDGQYNYCGDHTRHVEELLGFPPCVYFYAGRADPRYGSVALAFEGKVQYNNQIEEKFHSATPFDTGGIFQQDFEGAPEAFRLNLEPETQEARIEFCRKSVIPSGFERPANDSASSILSYEEHNFWGSRWRMAFAYWLDCYFEGNFFSYWTGKPTRPDLEGLYVLNEKWNAWTWEIRMTESYKIETAVRWSCSMEFANHWRDYLMVEGLEPEQSRRLELFLQRCEMPFGMENYCQRLEQWGQIQCRQS